MIKIPNALFFMGQGCWVLRVRAVCRESWEEGAGGRLGYGAG